MIQRHEPCEEGVRIYYITGWINEEVRSRETGRTVSDNLIHSELIEIECLPGDNRLKRRVGVKSWVACGSLRRLTYEYEDYDICDAGGLCQVLYQGSKFTQGCAYLVSNPMLIA